MPIPLATQADYEMLIAPVVTADEPRLAVYLEAASVVVYGKAPLLLGDQYQDPAAVPDTATLVTCQVAAGFMAAPTGAPGMVAQERVGFVETQYAQVSEADASLPASWKLLLKPWRLPEMASVQLDSPVRLNWPMDPFMWDWLNQEPEPASPWMTSIAPTELYPGGDLLLVDGTELGGISEVVFTIDSTDYVVTSDTFNSQSATELSLPTPSMPSGSTGSVSIRDPILGPVGNQMPFTTS